MVKEKNAEEKKDEEEQEDEGAGKVQGEQDEAKDNEQEELDSPEHKRARTH